jgi:hypothetical protein
MSEGARTWDEPEPKFKLMHISQVKRSAQAPRWLLHRFMPMTGLALFWGLRKSYKTFVVLDFCVAVAGAIDQWAGRKVAHGRVVYIVAEDYNGFVDRIEVYRLTIPGFDKLPLYVMRARPNLGVGINDLRRNEISDLDELVATVRAAPGKGGAVLVVVDTLSRTLHGKNENAEGMTNFVNNAESLADIIGCLVIAVHHEGSGETGRPRGHTSLDGGVVVNVHVRKTTTNQLDGPWTGEMEIVEGKNIPGGQTFAFALERCDIGDVYDDGSHDAVLKISEIAQYQHASESVEAKAKAKAKRRTQASSLALLMTCFAYVRDGKDGSERRQVRGYNGPWVNTVDAARVRDEFFKRYPKSTKPETETDPARLRRKEMDRKAKAFDRSVAKAAEGERLFSEVQGERMFLWE